jgi:hypothetical protein
MDNFIKAKRFAKKFGKYVEDWMLWDGWTNYIGCDECNTKGPKAPCWGVKGCHGYYNGCCCKNCVKDDELILQDFSIKRRFIGVFGRIFR